jgi:hypothetical protein
MKSYVILALAAIVLCILSFSALSVALGLLCRDTFREAVVVGEVVKEGAIALIDWFEFCRYSGAF